MRRQHGPDRPHILLLPRLQECLPNLIVPKRHWYLIILFLSGVKDVCQFALELGFELTSCLVHLMDCFPVFFFVAVEWCMHSVRFFVLGDNCG